MAATLLTALKHCDEQRDRAEVFQLERGRRVVVPKVIIRIADWARIAPPPAALPAKASHEGDEAVPFTPYAWKPDTP